MTPRPASISAQILDTAREQINAPWNLRSSKRRDLEETKDAKNEMGGSSYDPH